MPRRKPKAAAEKPDTQPAEKKAPRPRKPKPEAIDESRRIFLQNEIRGLLNSDEIGLVMPATLTKAERAYVHNYAPQLGLLSRSTGKGANRCLTLFKRIVATNIDTSFEPLLGEQAQTALVNALETMRLTGESDAPLVDGYALAPPDWKGSRFNRVHSDQQLVPPRPRTSHSIRQEREKLPIAAHRTEIMEALNSEQVIIISGETGSGKTTQVPQFIMEESAQQRMPCRIFCTQPRRIAAVTIAERVAYERSEKMGQQVGYQIRLENNFGPTTNLIYATSGCFLRSLMNNTRQAFQGITHLIIDEVHERDRNTDFLLIALRDELVRNRTLKVILMSATMNISLLSGYFHDCRVIQVPGSCYETRTFFLEDVLFYLNYETNAMRKILDEMPPDECREPVDIIASTDDEHMSQLDDDTRSYVDTLLASCRGAMRGKRQTDDTFEQLIYLIDGEGMPVDMTHSTGKFTPLIAAAMCNNLKYLEFFMARGADVKRTDMWGKSALDYARMAKDEKCVEPLQAYIAKQSSGHATVEEESSESIEQARILLAYQRQFLNRDDDEIDHDLLLELILTIHKAEFQGSILVFLPGYSDMMAQKDLIEKNLASSSYCLLLIHSSMSNEDQRMAFKPCPVRKIILATNIAETSLTFPDVSYVIDTGRVKQHVFDSTTNSSYLKSVEISKACAKQRAGRAGRTQTGICYRLYSSAKYEAMTEFPIAELLRIPLCEICLYTKVICGPNVSIAEYLAKALESPSKINILNAIQKLTIMGAMDKKENLTILGRRLADIPLDVHLGKCLLYAVLLRCLDPVLIIVVYLSAKDPFILSADREERGRTTTLRRKLSDNSLSDHVGIIRIYHMWLKCRHSRAAESNFLHEYNLSKSALETMQGVQRQILDYVQRSLLPPNTSLSSLNTNSNDWCMIRACLTAGLYPNVARVDRRKKKIRTQYESTVHFHTSSILRTGTGAQLAIAIAKDFPTDWVIFSEKSRINRSAVLRYNTMITPLTISLFCGPLQPMADNNIPDQNADENDILDDDDGDEKDYDEEEEDNEDAQMINESQLFAVDDWIELRIPKPEWTTVAQFKNHLVNAFIGFLHAGRNWHPEQYSILINTLRLLLHMDHKSKFGNDEYNLGLYETSWRRGGQAKPLVSKQNSSNREPKSWRSFRK